MVGRIFRRGTAALLGVLAAGSAAAQQLPGWRPADLCAGEPQQCIAFEALARQSVSGGWAVLPEAYRKTCLDEIKTPLDRSWRLLSQCLEQQVLKGLDKRTIGTLATPAEARSPAGAAASDGVPPPPFGLPAAPPKAD